MKVTAAVLALVAVMLSAVPAMASIADNTSRDTIVSQANAHHHHHHHHHRRHHGLADQLAGDLTGSTIG
ncbi:MAG TPA: hypothetical protein VHZ99_03485 [Steroidobacteraceae bacterium]|jgi:hypothetical protein|nr:hypothetical protein [Steroidobacteraceae bacterium]